MQATANGGVLAVSERQSVHKKVKKRANQPPTANKSIASPTIQYVGASDPLVGDQEIQ